MRAHRSLSRTVVAGFTLVEMLVVLSVIGVLMGVTLPAIQAMRESSRKVTCVSNLKQIGTALQTYHSSHRAFPLNYGNLGTDGDRVFCGRFSFDSGSASNTGRSWMLALLPFIDQQSLYNKVRFDQPLNFTDSTVTPAIQPNLEVAKTVIETYLCPSDMVGDGTARDRDINTFLPNIPLATVNYNAVSGSNWIYTSPRDRIPRPLVNAYSWLSIEADPLKLWYNSGRHSAEPNGIDCGNGFINRGGWKDGIEASVDVTSVEDLHIGASNTLAVGEVSPRIHPKKWWYWFDGVIATVAIPINYKPFQPPTNMGRPEEPRLNEWFRNYGFQSKHKGGSNFLIADGNVRLIDQNIDILLYRNLGNIQSDDPNSVMPAND